MTMTLVRLDRCLILLLFTFFCVLAFRISARAESPADQKNPFTGDAEAIAFGKIIYEATCTGYCHTTAAANRVGRCPNLFDCEWKHGNSDGEIYHIINVGVPNTEMVGFKGRLPDEMLWKITAYIRSASQCKEGQATAPAH
jgi:mono/diheme cytochrome c family protein